MQPQMFHRRIADVLAIMGGGVTAPRWIRADDGLSYIVKDEGAGLSTVRAAEFIWLSVANAIGLAAPKPEIFEDTVANRLVVGTRREQAAVGKDHASCLAALLGGAVLNGGVHLSRIYAFDLFSGNGDRHPGNYLILDEGGHQAVFAIDYSHVGLWPVSGAADPIAGPCNTRTWFPAVSAPYGHDIAAAVAIIDRLGQLPTAEIEAILTAIPDDWLPPTGKLSICDWWDGPDRQARAVAIREGLQNGTYV
ncbi:MAG: hypothetical protein Q7T19_07450 [Caulobacter sp.]|nr:hypothetical protein [Caulobacter sp.]